MGRAATVLRSRRAAAFLVVGAAVGVWYVVAPRLEPHGLWTQIFIASAFVIPGTLLLVLIALPIWSWRWMFPVGIVVVAVSFAFSYADWNIAANFARLWGYVFLGWAFLALFEEVSWIVVVALVIPFVDIVSVWRGPTHNITTKHMNWYEQVSVKFVVPGGGAVQFGPPDILFYALFLAATLRWNLRVYATWIATTGMYAVAIIVPTLAHRGGIAALPFLSFGFLVANADLLWRRLRKPAPSSSAG